MARRMNSENGEKESGGETSSQGATGTRKKRARRTAAKRRGPGRPKGTKSRRAGASPRAKRGARNKARRRFSPAERAKILATAKREGLTGRDVARRFDISEVTYYLWRKNARPAVHRAARAVRQSGVIDLAEEVRTTLEAQVRRLMPEVVQKEVDSLMAELTGTRRRGRRSR